MYRRLFVSSCRFPNPDTQRAVGIARRTRDGAAGRIFAHNRELQKSRFLHREASGGCDDWVVRRSPSGDLELASFAGTVPEINVSQFFSEPVPKKTRKRVRDADAVVPVTTLANASEKEEEGGDLSKRTEDGCTGVSYICHIYLCRSYTHTHTRLSHIIAHAVHVSHMCACFLHTCM